jgi:MOSC domain-containing protein
MLIEVDGIEAHEEDTWVGRRSRIGEALLEWGGHVGRCLTTSRDPESGRVDLATLDLLREYRADLDTTEPLPFGVYGSVVEPGVVRIGDRVTIE